MSPDAALEQLAGVLATPPDKTSLLETIRNVEAFGATAGEMIPEIAQHIQTAPPELAAILRRLERVLGDFSIAINHATDALTPAIRARIADR